MNAVLFLVMQRHARFALAPMSPGLAAVTYFVLSLPLILPTLGMRFGAGREVIALVVVSGMLIVMYALVWLFARPQVVELEELHLSIRFPARQRRLPRAGVTGVRRFARQQLKAELGFPLRIGVGGLWGVFGWLWTSRRGLVDVYLTSGDGGFVWVEREGGRPLLLSPERPAQFVEAVERWLERSE